MSKLMIVAAALALLGTLAGCTGTGVNTADVFTPQSGSIQLTAAVTDPTLYSAVEFVINEGDAAAETVIDDNPGDGIEVTYDTTKLNDGINYVKAYGVGTDGTRTQILDNALLIDNGGGGTATGETPTGGTDGGSTEGGSTAGELDEESGSLFRDVPSRRRS